MILVFCKFTYGELHFPSVFVDSQFGFVILDTEWNDEVLWNGCTSRRIFYFVDSFPNTMNRDCKFYFHNLCCVIWNNCDFSFIIRSLRWCPKYSDPPINCIFLNPSMFEKFSCCRTSCKIVARTRYLTSCFSQFC